MSSDHHNMRGSGLPVPAADNQGRSDYYRDVFEHLRLPVIILDKELKVVMTNPHFERMSGFSQEEIRGKSIWVFGISEESQRIIKDNYGLYSSDPGQSPIKYEIAIRDKEGRQRNWILRNAIMPDNGDIVVGLQDITKQRDAESRFRSSENYYRTVLENNNAATWLVEDDMTISLVNKECERVLGYTREELTGKSWIAIVSPEFLDMAKEYHIQRRANAADVPVKYMTKLIDKQGNIKEGQLSVGLIPGTKTSVVTFIDLTVHNHSMRELEKYLKKMRRVLIQAANALGTALEKRDPYTAGHQRKVAELSLAIAREMQLPEQQCEGIAVAASLHDIGKITVPSEILSWPGELSDLEMAIVKTHCQTGYEIVKDIEFAWPVADIVLQHHERMDGSGYPQGLQGEEILLEARIIAVADVVEAMISHRPYRLTLGNAKALEEISLNKGRLYDPEVVDACLKLFKEKGFAFE